MNSVINKFGDISLQVKNSIEGAINNGISNVKNSIEGLVSNGVSHVKSSIDGAIGNGLVQSTPIFIVVAMIGVYISMSGNRKLGTKISSGAILLYILLEVCYNA